MIMRAYQVSSWQRYSSRKTQSGAVLIVALITMSFLLLGTVALIRSSETSNALAGSMGFKRDMVNQAERAMDKVSNSFLLSNGALASESTRESNLPSSNYFASMLSTNSKGIPSVLIKDSLFTSAVASAGDITLSTSGAVVASNSSDASINIRYVVDRLCNAAGTFDYTTCASLKNSSTQGGSSSNATLKVGLAYQPVYRVSVRVEGPNNSRSYLQTTISD